MAQVKSRPIFTHLVPIPGNRSQKRQLTRRRPREGGAIHQPAMALIVVHGIVLRKQIVPNGESTGTPAETAAEFRPRCMALDLIENRAAFHFGEAIEARDVERVEE